MTAVQPVIPVPGRNCDGCAMCCKLPVIPELNKPYNTWCQHCTTRTSCDIHPTRPDRCRDYHCHFLLSDLSEEWRPSHCRFMVSVLSDKILIFVDPSRPDSWRKEPYFGNIKHWSSQVPVHVKINSTTYVVFPDHVDDVGEVTEDHLIAVIDEGGRKRAVRIHKSEVPADMQVGTSYNL